MVAWWLCLVAAARTPSTLRQRFRGLNGVEGEHHFSWAQSTEHVSLDYTASHAGAIVKLAEWGRGILDVECRTGELRVHTAPDIEKKLASVLLVGTFVVDTAADRSCTAKPFMRRIVGAAVDERAHWLAFHADEASYFHMFGDLDLSFSTNILYHKPIPYREVEVRRRRAKAASPTRLNGTRGRRRMSLSPGEVGAAAGSILQLGSQVGLMGDNVAARIAAGGAGSQEELGLASNGHFGPGVYAPPNHKQAPRILLSAPVAHFLPSGTSNDEVTGSWYYNYPEAGPLRAPTWDACAAQTVESSHESEEPIDATTSCSDCFAVGAFTLTFTMHISNSELQQLDIIFDGDAKFQVGTEFSSGQSGDREEFVDVETTYFNEIDFSVGGIPFHIDMSIPVSVGYSLKNSVGPANFRVRGQVHGPVKYGMSYEKDRNSGPELQYLNANDFDFDGSVEGFSADQADFEIWMRVPLNLRVRDIGGPIAAFKLSVKATAAENECYSGGGTVAASVLSTATSTVGGTLHVKIPSRSGPIYGQTEEQQLAISAPIFGLDAGCIVASSSRRRTEDSSSSIDAPMAAGQRLPNNRRLEQSTIEVSAGDFPSEVSWTLSCDDVSYLSGGAPYSGSVDVAGGSSCTLSLSDSYGDGWNGAVWSGFEQALTFNSGNSATGSFVVAGSTSGSVPLPVFNNPGSTAIGSNWVGKLVKLTATEHNYIFGNAQPEACRTLRVPELTLLTITVIVAPYGALSSGTMKWLVNFNAANRVSGDLYSAIRQRVWRVDWFASGIFRIQEDSR